MQQPHHDLCAGQACAEYHKLNIPTYGVYLRATEKGQFLAKLRAYPEQDIRVRLGRSGRSMPLLPRLQSAAWLQLSQSGLLHLKLCADVGRRGVDVAGHWCH